MFWYLIISPSESTHNIFRGEMRKYECLFNKTDFSRAVTMKYTFYMGMLTYVLYLDNEYVY